MKKTLFFSLLAFLALGPAYGGTITVTQPAGGDVALGTACPISWTATGITSNVRINLITPGGALVGLIIGNQAADSSPYTWTVGAPAVAGERYRVRVAASDGSGMGESAIFTVIAGGGDPIDPGASITVTQPDAGSSWRPGTRQTLTWTKSGSMPFMVQITLRREGAPESEDPVLRIADGCANNGSRTWSIPDSLDEGRYFVRVRASRTLHGDSAVFAIAVDGTRGEVAGPLTPIRCDLEMPGVGVEYYNGNILAWVKNNGPDSLRNHDVSFRLNFPESGRGEQVITRRLTVPVGAEQGVDLFAISADEIPDTGLRTSVRIDTSGSHIQDANQLNQHRDVRVGALDLQCWMPGSEFEVVKKYTLPAKFVVRVHVHVRHNLGREVRNVHVRCYVSRSRGGGPLLVSSDGHALLDGESEFTIASLMPGQGVNHYIEQEYYTSGGFPPTLSDGTTYYVIARIVDDENRFFDVNPSNDSDTRSFTTPD